MKKLFLAAFLIAFAVISSAHAQSFSAGVNGKKRPQPQRKTAPVHRRGPVGALPRTARNPIQLINPRAPQRYFGPPSETVVSDNVANTPTHQYGESANRYTGVVLVGYRW